MARVAPEAAPKQGEAAFQPPLRVSSAQLDLSAYPNVDGWLARCTSRPAVPRAATR